VAKVPIVEACVLTGRSRATYYRRGDSLGAACITMQCLCTSRHPLMPLTVRVRNISCALVAVPIYLKITVLVRPA
jgi:hypothetical protein